MPRRQLTPLALALAGCATSPLDDFASEPFDPLHRVPVLSVPPSLAPDPATATAGRIHVGDCAVYSLQLRRPGTIETWFIRMAIAEHRPFADGQLRISYEDDEAIELSLSGAVRFHVLVTDETGDVVGDALTETIAAEVVQAGFARACEFFRAHAGLPPAAMRQKMRELPDDERRATLLSTLAFTTTMSLVLGAEPLAPLLAKVVRRPSLLGIVGNLGSGVEVLFDYPAARPWTQPTRLPGDAAFVVPIDVRAFGERALEASMVVVRSEQHMHVTVGVVSIAGRHPDDPQTSVQLGLQAVGRVSPTERARIVRAAELDPVR